jgi:hypothetical protein
VMRQHPAAEVRAPRRLAVNKMRERPFHPGVWGGDTNTERSYRSFTLSPGLSRSNLRLPPQTLDAKRCAPVGRRVMTWPDWHA